MTTGQRQAGTATLTTPGDREIHVERVFDAPRDTVWALMNDPQLIPEWWGPRRMTTTVDRYDFRPGGSWRFVHVDGDGQEHAFRGDFREIEAPERIVRTFEWEGMPGHVSVETATFEDLGEQTRLTVVSVFDDRADRDGMVAAGMERGLQETYRRFDELLARRAG